MQNVNTHLKEILTSSYFNLFESFFKEDHRVTKSFIFIDKKTLDNTSLFQCTLEVMLEPSIISDEVDLISLEVKVNEESCEICFFANDGKIFLEERELFESENSFRVIVESYISKFTSMFESMVSKYTFKS